MQEPKCVCLPITASQLRLLFFNFFGLSNGCRSSKEDRHKVSLLGSLAHRYSLCNSYEQCLNEHMKIVNRRRDVEAAHSGVTEFVDRAVPVARRQLGDDTSDLGDNFVHMLGHISDIEQRMFLEFRPMIAAEARRI
jgi:hypothetical protein